MSENSGQSASVDVGKDEPKGFTPIASQADLDRIISERLNRERSRFADYDELKAKAEQLDQIEEANKTELQKALDQAAQAQQELAAAKTETLRLQAAAKHGIPADHIEFLNASDEASLEAQAQKLAASLNRDPATGGAGPVVHSEGGQPNGDLSTNAAQFAAALEELNF